MQSELGEEKNNLICYANSSLNKKNPFFYNICYNLFFLLHFIIFLFEVVYTEITCTFF